MYTFYSQNFSVCQPCGRLAQLYHKLCHQKHRTYEMCSNVVEQRKKNAPRGIETTNILNELLANENWLEQVSLIIVRLMSPLVTKFFFYSNLQQFRKIQDLWADADTHIR